MHENNAFITLTYSDKNLPYGHSLDHRHWQTFFKRLKRRPRGVPDLKIRFYMCGEYGPNATRRPHFHALLFGHHFPDQYWWKNSPGTNLPLYRSKTLEKSWTAGHSYIGTVTFKSAAYVARYCMKKINGPEADEHYNPHDPDTGELKYPNPLKPEYNRSSLKHGIGYPWFEKFGDEVYPADEIVMDGYRQRPPKYYDKLYERTDPDGFQAVLSSRIAAAKEQTENATPERLKVRETVLEAKLKRLKRNLE